jgi:predicted DNA-binding transcriptional regulator AlpA
MSNSQSGSALRLLQSSGEQPGKFEPVPDTSPAPGGFSIESDNRARTVGGSPFKDPLLTAGEVAERLNVTKDWVWDHSSRKAPHLPVIRMGDGTLRYRASKIEEFIDERERLSNLHRRRGPAQKALGREINPTVFPASEFPVKTGSWEPFLSGISVPSEEHHFYVRQLVRAVGAGQWG